MPGATGMLQLRASLKSRRFRNDHEALLPPCSPSPFRRRLNEWLPDPVTLSCTLALSIMLAMARGRIEAGQREHLRSLTKSA